jgi:hypothetical protein
MVVSHDNIEQILIVQLHSLTLEVVVFEFRLKSDRHPALTGKFEEASLWLLEWGSWLTWRRLRNALWGRPRVPSWWLLIVMRHLYANI